MRPTRDGALASHRLEDCVAQALARDSRRIIVTGASGWLGMCTLDLLRQVYGASLESRVHCFGSTTRQLTLRGGTAIRQQPLDALASLDQRPSIVLHLAFLTKDRVAAMTEAEYIAANRSLSHLVEQSLDRLGANAIFVPSSGAATKANDVSVPQAMRLYGELKRQDEAMFGSWASERGAAAAIVRVFNVAGPFINKHEAYALAAFIRDALAGRPIRVGATKPVWRSYVAIRELMSVVFGLLLRPNAEIARFETAGSAAIEIGGLAVVVNDVLDGRGVERPPVNGADEDRYVGDRSAYVRHLKMLEIAEVPLWRQIEETAASMVPRGNP